MNSLASALDYFGAELSRLRESAPPDEHRGPASLSVHAHQGCIRARATSCAECVDGYTWVTNEDGYNVTRQCRCGRLLGLARRINAAKMPADHIGSVLNNADASAARVPFDPTRSEQAAEALAASYRFIERVRDFDPDAQRAPLETVKPPGLFLGGGAGRGKTHLIVGICRALLSRGFHVEYRSWVDWSRELWGAMNARRDARERNTHSGVTNPDDDLRRAALVPILALDELGANLTAHHGGAAIERGWIESVLKMRHEAGLPLLLASNFHLADGKPGSLQVDETIVSRIAGRCDVVTMGGEDQRRRGK